jgi:hypothetical protein
MLSPTDSVDDPERTLSRVATPSTARLRALPPGLRASSWLPRPGRKGEGRGTVARPGLARKPAGGATRLLHPARMSKDSVMTEGPEDFACPQCGAHYKLVRVKPGPRTTNRPVHCKVCGHSLAPRDGEDVLKYFLVSKERRTTSPT